MTLKYMILKKLFIMTNFKKIFGKPNDQLLKEARKMNSRNKVPKLKDRNFEFETITVDECKVLVMKHKQKTAKACLFLIGGGMIHSPSAANIRRALKYARDCGRDLYVPYYPLCTDHPLTAAYSMIYHTYLLMLKEYDHHDISIFGSSSGGNLALGLCAYLNNNHLDTPRPEKIIALSPGTCVDTEEEWQRMQELNEKDVAIDAAYMKNAIEIMKCGCDDVPDYMIWLQKADFSNFPEVYINYGSDECLYACWDSIRKAFEKHGVNYHLLVGENMYHCYPILPLVKEAQEGYRWLIEVSL